MILPALARPRTVHSPPTEETVGASCDARYFATSSILFETVSAAEGAYFTVNVYTVPPSLVFIDGHAVSPQPMIILSPSETLTV